MISVTWEEYAEVVDAELTEAMKSNSRLKKIGGGAEVNWSQETERR